MLAVRRAAYDAMVEQAIAGAPEEVCGVLSGRFDVRESTVETIEQATNVATVPKSKYVIAPGEQLDLMDRLEDRGHDVVGFYHSHPHGPAAPSMTDADRATWPDRSFVIIDTGGKHPVVGSWRWDDERTRFVREALRVE